MKVLISVDIEGITGVVAINHTTPGNQEYERFRKLMTADTNAAIEGALAGGADEVVVNDGHKEHYLSVFKKLSKSSRSSFAICHLGM